jgi:hypothetical protein
MCEKPENDSIKIELSSKGKNGQILNWLLITIGLSRNQIFSINTMFR